MYVLFTVKLYDISLWIYVHFDFDVVGTVLCGAYSSYDRVPTLLP